MQYVLLTMFLSLLYFGISSERSAVTDSLRPSSYEQTATSNAQSFTAYRDAVFQYAIDNPDFVGEVPSDSITISPEFTATVVANYSNYIVATSSEKGRIVYSFTTYSPKLLNELLAGSDNDASWGSSAGGNWNSAAVGLLTAPIVLPSEVPDNMTVSAIQIGV